MCDVWAFIFVFCASVMLCLIGGCSQAKRGRKSKADLLRNSKQEETTKCVQQCKCKEGCFEIHIQEMVKEGYNRKQAVREIAVRMTTWRENLASTSDRAERILDYLNAAWDHTEQEVLGKKRTSNQHYLLPKTDIKLCLNCFGLAAGLCDYDKNGTFRRGAMFKLVCKAFNKQEVSAENVYPAQNEDKIPGENLSVEGGIFIWLTKWLPGNTDATPFSPDKLHLDAPSRKYVYEEMCSEWRHQGRIPPSLSAFLRVLRSRFKLIIHKHKKFAECQVCSLFKELWAKSKHETSLLRTEIKELRRTHLGVYCTCVLCCGCGVNVICLWYRTV
jgi:hypothetical protein